MKKTLILGLTGPSGSGKTKLGEYLETLGFTSLNADEIYHGTIKRGRPCFEHLVGYFGKEILGSDGEIDRKKLGNIVFSDSKELLRLEKITHPFVLEDIREEIEKTLPEGGVVLDAPTLFESESSELCHKNIALLGDTEVRLKRVIERDKISREAARKRIDNQKADEYYKERADFVFDGTQEFEVLKGQIGAMLDRLSGEYTW